MVSCTPRVPVRPISKFGRVPKNRFPILARAPVGADRRGVLAAAAGAPRQPLPPGVLTRDAAQAAVGGQDKVPNTASGGGHLRQPLPPGLLKRDAAQASVGGQDKVCLTLKSGKSITPDLRQSFPPTPRSACRRMSAPCAAAAIADSELSCDEN